MRWLVATVAETVPETSVAVSLRLDVPDWPGHRAGQHVDVQLTADDGYSAQRSYSIASRPGATHLELTVVRIDQGEVSPYLTTVVKGGDQFELRGPIGGYFVWDADDARPVLLVGGGSGVVPLMAMLRHHAALQHPAPIRLIYSARTRQDILYREELAKLVDSDRIVTITLTREAPTAWRGRIGRVDGKILSELGWPPEEEPHCYICGPTPFVENVADALVALGHDAANVKTERFGPTGRGDGAVVPRDHSSPS
jgi:ferredoxin-NADP reductase